MIDETTKTARTTEPMYLRVRPEVRARAIDAAEGYGMTTSEWVSSLILGHDPAPKTAIDVGAIAILGQRVVAALAALPDGSGEARPALEALRKAIIETMLSYRETYDAKLDRRGAEGRWG